MNYFSDIRFIKYGEVKFYAVKNSRYFDGYYGIQYNHAGELILQIDGKNVQHLSEPCFFVTGPGMHFKYGAPLHQTRHHFFLCFQGRRVQRWLTGGRGRGRRSG